MSDDKSKRNFQDSSKVNLNESYEVRYWCTKFNCDANELKDAVQHVGSSSSKIENYLRHRK